MFDIDLYRFYPNIIYPQYNIYEGSACILDMFGHYENSPIWRHVTDRSPYVKCVLSQRAFISQAAPTRKRIIELCIRKKTTNKIEFFL